MKNVECDLCGHHFSEHYEKGYDINGFIQHGCLGQVLTMIDEDTGEAGGWVSCHCDSLTVDGHRVNV